MNNNKVFVIGEEVHGKLGLGHVEVCQNLTEISELSDKRIEEFLEGNDCMFARSDINNIYSCGLNEHGQLGRGFKCDEILKPKKIEFLSDKNIITISCGYNHCLALSSNGQIYGWGLNDEGQVGCGKIRKEYILFPKLIDISLPIKFIECNYDNTFAVDIEGGVYYWGSIGDDIQWKPKKMNVKNVIKINYYDDCEKHVIVLKETGKLFEYNFVENKIIREFIVGLKVKDIFDNLCETEECVYQIYSKVKTNYINFYDYYSSEMNETYKTIHVKTEESDGQEVKYLITKDIKLNPEYNQQTNRQLLVLDEKNVFERKFLKTFIKVKGLGEGSYGEVYKMREKSTGDMFAIKRIQMKSDINFFQLFQF